MPLKDKEKRRAYQKKYAEEHKEELALYKKQRHEDNREKDAEYGRTYLDDLEIECFQCNWCLSVHGRYPDELPQELRGISVTADE